jgi:hypothetical protein
MICAFTCWRMSLSMMIRLTRLYSFVGKMQLLLRQIGQIGRERLMGSHTTISRSIVQKSHI